MLNRTASSPQRSAPPPREGESVVELFRRLMDELGQLFRREVALALAEASSALSRVLIGASSVAIGGVVVFAGFVTLLAAAVLGLALVMPAWLAALVVGGAVVTLGAILVLVGVKRFSAAGLAPRRSVESLRQDKDVLLRREP